MDQNGAALSEFTCTKERHYQRKCYMVPVQLHKFILRSKNLMLGLKNELLESFRTAPNWLDELRGYFRAPVQGTLL